MTTPAAHPMDQAVALRLLQSPDARSGEIVWQGHTHADYANMVGPYGGITAAQALQSVLQHPQLLGVPVALTINYAAALADGEFTIRTRPARTNRSTQHWVIEILQGEATVITGTAMTALRRQTYSGADVAMPSVPGVDGLPPRQISNPLPWLNRYDQRVVEGDFPAEWDASEHSSQSTVWMRDEPPRPLDFVSLTGLADVFFPRIWRRRALRVPAGTVSLTVYFHADADMLANTGTAHVLGRARMQAAFNGYFDQTATLWAPNGAVLATTHQLVYYKE